MRKFHQLKQMFNVITTVVLFMLGLVLSTTEKRCIAFKVVKCVLANNEQICGIGKTVKAIRCLNIKFILTFVSRSICVCI